MDYCSMPASLYIFAVNQIILLLMEQINNVHLRGNVGSVRTSVLSNGRSVCNIAVATNIITRSHDNTMVQETQWTNCVVWSSPKFPDLDSINVGAGVELKGRLRSNRYTSQTDGVERMMQEVMVSELTLLPQGERLTPIVL